MISNRPEECPYQIFFPPRSDFRLREPRDARVIYSETVPPTIIQDVVINAFARDALSRNYKLICDKDYLATHARMTTPISDSTPDAYPILT